MRWNTDGRVHWLYRVYGADDALLYIGLTVNPDSRFAHHKTSATGGAKCTAQKWYPLAHHVEWETAGLIRSMAEVREMDAIQSERPAFNRQLRNDAAGGAAIVHILDEFFPLAVTA